MMKTIAILAQGGTYPNVIEWRPIIVWAVAVALAVAGLLSWGPVRRRLRFSLLTLLILIAALGVTLGWQVRFVHHRQAMRRQIEQSGGMFLDGDVNGRFRHERSRDESQAVSTIRMILGDENIRTVVFPRLVTPADLEAARAFPEAAIVGDERFGSRVLDF